MSCSTELSLCRDLAAPSLFGALNYVARKQTRLHGSSCCGVRRRRSSEDSEMEASWNALVGAGIPSQQALAHLSIEHSVHLPLQATCRAKGGIAEETSSGDAGQGDCNGRMLIS
eukprot:4318657-Amphidinium_carterae.1